MTRINLNRTKMTRSSALQSIETTHDSVAWGKKAWGKKLKDVVTANTGTIHALVFSAVLIACSLGVGCSSDRPKPVSSNNQVPVAPTQSPVAAMPAPVLQADAKPVPKKVVHRKPATVNYTDKTYGVTFEYPRRYAIETGDAAAELLLSSTVPMNFVQPGGVALAAVELPETGFANTDFSSAFFNVSVHKTLTPDQCNEFAVPQPKNPAPSSAKTPDKTADTIVQAAPTAANVTETKPLPATSSVSSDTQTTQATPVSTDNANPAQSPATSESAQTSASQPVVANNGTTGSSVQSPAEQGKSEQPAVAKVAHESTTSAAPAPEPQASKLLLSDLMLQGSELRGTEAVSGEGTRQSDSRYFHVFQNGACYEFALNVTTVASEDHMTKHVDRDKVFAKLEKIMATVRIDANPAPLTPEATAEKSVTAAPTPAQ